MRTSKQRVGGPKPPVGTPANPLSLRDLAAYLGLSRSTVSLVLNNSPVAQGLTQETRDRVLKAATELHYKANYFARMLNNKRSHMVGILSPDLGEGYDAAILNGIERLLLERDYLYFVSSHHWNRDLIRQRLEVFAERGAEGVILINTPAVTAPNLPLVSIGSLEYDFPLTHITLDNAHGIRLALEHLHALGHRRIAFLKGHTQSSDAESRWASCVEAARGLRLRIHKEDVVQLKRIDDGLDPIREGYVAGKRIPEEISVVGFDDIQAATIVLPALTTVRQPLIRMGILAASELLASIEDASLQPRHISILPELMIRQSTAACSR